jgi:putative transposase
LSKQIRLEVANEFILTGCSVKTVLKSCFIARSSFYYKATLGKSGRKLYAVFLNEKGDKIDAQQVIDALKKLFEKPFVDYGYYKSYIYLRDDLGFKVSKHSVYKLMKMSDLLQNRYAISSKKGQRNWVKDLIPQTQIPFDYLEFDRGGGPYKVCMDSWKKKKYASFDSFRCKFTMEFRALLCFFNQKRRCYFII